jgi:uncharacterized protein
MEFKREEYLNKLISHKGNNMIKIITGIRRCGKSYLLNKIFYKHLLDSGIKDKNIIRFAFDFDEDVDKLDAFFKELPSKIKDDKGHLVVNSKKFRAYISSLIKNKKETYYLLLDEVQLLENFVGTLNGYLYYENLEVYVTGSNSKFLSSDIATEFRGRGDVIYIQPLTFSEYYEVIGGDKKEALFEYMRYGGLPLSVLAKDDISKQEYLSNLYHTIYLNDLKERNNIKKIEEFDSIVVIISSLIGSATNPTKLANTFHSNIKSKVTIETIRKYITYLEDAFLVNKAQRYNVKGRKYIGSNEKYYFTDLGIRNSILGYRQFEPTHLMENLIYNELIHRGFLVDVGITLKNVRANNGNGAKEYYEIDFVANKGSKKFYIQSAYSIIGEEKIKQEEKSLDNINDNFDKVIITFDDFITYHRNQKGYIVMNLLEFLLNKEYLN